MGVYGVPCGFQDNPGGFTSISLVLQGISGRRSLGVSWFSREFMGISWSFSWFQRNSDVFQSVPGSLRNVQWVFKRFRPDSWGPYSFRKFHRRSMELQGVSRCSGSVTGSFKGFRGVLENKPLIYPETLKCLDTPLKPPRNFLDSPLNFP